MPFIERLDVVPLPKGFILPQFTQYNGTGDPIKHLQGFLGKMTITSNNPDVYAKAFSNCLSDKALDWYMVLPLKSIDSYQQTADVFIAKFGSSIQEHQDERVLMDIQQGPNESLRNYHKRYNDILLTIPQVNNQVAYMAFYRRLTYVKLKKLLVLATPLSKDELTARVRQYVELEELKNKESHTKDLRVVIVRKRNRSKSPKKTPKGLVRCTHSTAGERITPLRISVAEVFSKIEDKNLLPKPVRMRSAPGKRDKNRCCKYHREHGHDTNECRILKAELEKLIKRGYLKEFVDKETQRDAPSHNRMSPLLDNRPKVKREKLEAPPIMGRIDTISGGIAGGGDSRNSRKIYARRGVYSLNKTTPINELITFSDQELQGI
ncbi:hypothetical protein LIER_28632 [Lithospermum erythrorhizon]|uniref:Retrotransposon gag domain-containing protein n=1 Tax=Lithospermum erythrorhizon TaxID=34254 RepID=A0AAV3RGS6_LITER